MIVNCYKIRFLKLIFSFLIGCSVQHNTALAMAIDLDVNLVLNNQQGDINPEQKPAIIFDLDDTVIQVDKWSSAPGYIKQLISRNFFTLVFLKWQRVPDSHGIKRYKATDSDNFGPGGGATSLGFYGLYGNNLPRFQKAVPEVLKIAWQNAVFIPGAKTLLDYLYDKGYPIVYATNKDYTSYVHVAKTMDEKYNGAFSKYPKFVLVTHPKKETLDKWSNEVENKQNTIPENFRALIKEIADGKENSEKRIYFADGYEKPVPEYYLKLKELMKIQGLNTEKYIFFDDKEINITGAQKYGIDGYTIKNVADIVKGLEQKKIINPEKDPLLYAQLAEEGVFGLWKKITGSVTSKTYQKEQPAQ